MRVLVVEDELKMARLVKRGLEGDLALRVNVKRKT